MARRRAARAQPIFCERPVCRRSRRRIRRSRPGSAAMRARTCAVVNCRGGVLTRSRARIVASRRIVLPRSAPASASSSWPASVISAMLSTARRLRSSGIASWIHIGTAECPRRPPTAAAVHGYLLHSCNENAIRPRDTVVIGECRARHRARNRYRVSSGSPAPVATNTGPSARATTKVSPGSAWNPAAFIRSALSPKHLRRLASGKRCNPDGSYGRRGVPTQAASATRVREEASCSGRCRAEEDVTRLNMPRCHACEV